MDRYTQALTLGRDILVVGDLNCKVMNPHSPEEVALVEMCNSVSLTQLIKEPIWVTATSSTLIDMVMTCNIKLVEKSGVIISHISDHYLAYATLKLKLPKPPVNFVNQDLTRVMTAIDLFVILNRYGGTMFMYLMMQVKCWINLITCFLRCWITTPLSR